jgi:hypothetical protein
MNTDGRVEIYVYGFVTSALDGEELSASFSAGLPPGKESTLPIG